MLFGSFIVIDKLERLNLLQSDPFVNEFAISITELESVSRFLRNFRYKTTQMLRKIKSYLTGYFRSGYTYTANCSAEMIKEIMPHLKWEPG